MVVRGQATGGFVRKSPRRKAPSQQQRNVHLTVGLMTVPLTTSRSVKSTCPYSPTAVSHNGGRPSVHQPSCDPTTPVHSTDLGLFPIVWPHGPQVKRTKGPLLCRRRLPRSRSPLRCCCSHSYSPDAQYPAIVPGCRGRGHQSFPDSLIHIDAFIHI